ncbi:MAG: zinc ribbon domain-containing protein, partial [Candidatus Norongarragalinales archaeon]
SGCDVDNALLALQGLTKPEDKTEEQIKVCFCPRCREKNSPIAKFCLRCGTPMDAQIMAQVEEEKKNGDELMNALMKDAEFKEFLYKKAVALGFEKKL